MPFEFSETGDMNKTHLYCVNIVFGCNCKPEDKFLDRVIGKMACSNPVLKRTVYEKQDTKEKVTMPFIHIIQISKKRREGKWSDKITTTRLTSDTGFYFSGGKNVNKDSSLGRYIAELVKLRPDLRNEDNASDVLIKALIHHEYDAEKRQFGKQLKANTWTPTKFTEVTFPK